MPRHSRAPGSSGCGPASRARDRCPNPVDGRSGGGFHGACLGGDIRRPSLANAQAVPVGQGRVRRRIARIEPDRTPQQLAGLLEGWPLEAENQIARLNLIRWYAVRFSGALRRLCCSSASRSRGTSVRAIFAASSFCVSNSVGSEAS